MPKRSQLCTRNLLLNLMKEVDFDKPGQSILPHDRNDPGDYVAFVNFRSQQVDPIGNAVPVVQRQPAGPLDIFMFPQFATPSVDLAQRYIGMFARRKREEQRSIDDGKSIK